MVNSNSDSDNTRQRARLTATTCRSMARCVSTSATSRPSWHWRWASGAASETLGSWVRNTNHRRIPRGPTCHTRRPIRHAQISSGDCLRRARPLWSTGDEMGQPGLTVSSSCIWPLSFPFLFSPSPPNPGYLTSLSLSWKPASFTRSLIHACTAALRSVTLFTHPFIYCPTLSNDVTIFPLHNQLKRPTCVAPLLWC
jgi:hypothetical protein